MKDYFRLSELYDINAALHIAKKSDYSHLTDAEKEATLKHIDFLIESLHDYMFPEMNKINVDINI